jgi:hypothetical protein
MLFLAGPVENHGHIYLHSRLLRILKWGLPFEKRRTLTTTGHSPSTTEWLPTLTHFHSQFTDYLLSQVIDDGARQHQLFRFVTAKSKSRYDRPWVCRSVFVSSPISGPRPDFCYCQTLAVLLVCGALSDERTGLSFVAVILSRTWHLYLQFYLSAYYILICQESGPLWVYIIYTFIRNSSTYVRKYIQGLCQSRLGTADHALTPIAHDTTAA